VIAVKQLFDTSVEVVHQRLYDCPPGCERFNWCRIRTSLHQLP